MILQVLSTLPHQGDNDIAIDSPVIVNFNQAVDKFTIENGVSLYILDNELGYEFLPYAYTFIGNRLTITPTSLVPNKKHFLSILPGNDPSRFLSSETISAPIYTRVGLSTGTAEILSYFSGVANATFTLVVGANNTVDITKGITYIGSFTYTPDTPISIGEFSFSLNGIFDEGDEISINCFKAVGVDVIYKVDFDTTEYTTIANGSFEITDEYLDSHDIINTSLYIVDSIPENLSVDNIKCNPIVLKFNKDLVQDQDIASKLKITKSEILGSGKRNVEFESVISGNILKIYLKSVGNPSL